MSRIDADRPMEPAAVFHRREHKSLSHRRLGRAAVGDPELCAENGRESIFSKCAQAITHFLFLNIALAWYFNDGHAMTVMGGSSRRCSRERGGSSSAGLRCNRFTSSAAPSLIAL